LEKLLSPDEFNQLMAFLATDETTLPEFGGWEAFSLVDILRIIADGLPQVIIISGILGLALGIWMSRSLTAPLSQLTEAAKAIGAQDLSRRVEIKGSREIKELAQTLNQMAANLEQAEHLRRNMMADVSHELRTPLTVLEGNLRAALDRVYHLNEEDMAQLYTQTHHLTLLVNDLRELSLAEAKKLPLDFQETNIAQLVRETAALFKPLAQEKDISLTYRLPDNLPPIQVDPARIRQALHNLLANALRHTPPGGNIAIAVEIQDKTLSIAIEDNGAGIAPEHLNQVFERFYRADPARARSTGGAGLGLAIVKAIVEAHHGRVSVSSKGSGQGSAFTIYLPL
ncbi:MAG TPA: HAMP domain-containing protein, partial [Anaerolineae bacterium]|nr:HAMP domain-containing protein [Anaerolineae bacterium]